MNAKTLLPMVVAAVVYSGAVADAGELPEGGRGKTVYQMNCAGCHTAGITGAPKLGDSRAWSARLSAGVSPLYSSAVKGKGAMPPKGGNAGLTDADIRAAVDFIVSQVQRLTAPSERAAAPAEKPAAKSEAPAAEAQRVAAARPVPVFAVAPQTSSDPNAFNRLFVTRAQRNAPPAEDGIHDPASPGTAALQPPSVAFERLPQGSAGNYVNWVAALRRKQIQPRWDLKNASGEPALMDLNIVREVKGSMPDVVYPHKQHTEWLDCANCHPGIFVPQKGANRMSMAAIMLGQGCGTCHGKIAFPVSECRLCHSRNKDATARAGTSGR